MASFSSRHSNESTERFSLAEQHRDVQQTRVDEVLEPEAGRRKERGTRRTLFGRPLPVREENFARGAESGISCFAIEGPMPVYDPCR